MPSLSSCRPRNAISFTRTMRAGKFRGWRIRSPSSRNELIESDICQQARQCRAFLFPGFLFPKLFTSALYGSAVTGSTDCAVRNSQRSVFLLTPFRSADGECRWWVRRYGHRPLTGHAFEIAIATASPHSTTPRGYPVSMSKKKRACVVTYRHSGERLFENSVLPHTNVNIL